MKKSFFLLLSLCSLFVFVGCKQNKSSEKDVATIQMRDSLNKIITQRDNEINDMVATLNEIEQGFRDINQAQGRVTVAKDGEGANSKQRLRENIQFIQSAMAQNQELIEKLKRQLRESSFNSEELKKTIANLSQQMEEKNREMAALQAELEAKNIHIAELDQQISGLNQDVANLKQESGEKSQTISQQDKQLNTAWFVFGTKSELKDQRILVDGDVLRANFNKDYFTKIDIRVDKEIKLYSKSAKILTSHPAGSYTLQPDANKQYILRITNPQAFWGASRYLVIQVK